MGEAVKLAVIPGDGIGPEVVVGEHVTRVEVALGTE